ncbi:MAG TPA: hypothetical protein VHA33_25755 [Candidatus Angelobacter sp.]|jgi:hypothetical protein|nr:hypothetical protein [Candidatus Angelobacter sp.]
MAAFFNTDAQNKKQPFVALSLKEQQSLTRRLTDYINAYRTRNWKALYDLVSDTGKNGVNRPTFIEAMENKHGKEYADMPDLLAFTPSGSDKNEDGLMEAADGGA